MAKILFRPVCSACGRILLGEEINISYQSLIDDVYSQIEPEICPFCDVSFEQIQMPDQLPFQCESYIERSDFNGRHE